MPLDLIYVSILMDPHYKLVVVDAPEELEDVVQVQDVPLEVEDVSPESVSPERESPERESPESVFPESVFPEREFPEDVLLKVVDGLENKY